MEYVIRYGFCRSVGRNTLAHICFEKSQGSTCYSKPTRHRTYLCKVPNINLESQFYILQLQAKSSFEYLSRNIHPWTRISDEWQEHRPGTDEGTHPSTPKRNTESSILNRSRARIKSPNTNSGWTVLDIGPRAKWLVLPNRTRLYILRRTEGNWKDVD